MFSFCDCGSYGEIGGDAYASRFAEAAAWSEAAMDKFRGSELNDEKGDWAIGAIDEPKEPERFISGGESSREERLGRRWLGGVLYGFAMSCVGVKWGGESLWA
jgi:hypothetical protein